MFTEEETERAYDLMNLVVTGKRFAMPGHRNNDAVNLCIAEFVVSQGDIAATKKRVEGDARAYIVDIVRDYAPFMEHVERVLPYCESWGEDALGYII